VSTPQTVSDVGYILKSKKNYFFLRCDPSLPAMAHKYLKTTRKVARLGVDPATVVGV
jgi:diaminopimelate decarboxylase